MTNAVSTQLKTVSESLKTLLRNKSEALPRNFNETRFLQNCLTVLSDTKDIEKCDAKSIARTMLKGAFLGLDFFNRECYAITYGGKVQFQTDYKGEIKLAKKYSVNPIKDIYAKVVREGDEFSAVIKDGLQTVNFKPISFSDASPVGVFAVVYFKDGSMSYETMTVAEVEKTRQDWSKCKESSAWVKSPLEMYKKTVLRRLCKGIELDFDNPKQREAFEDGGDIDLRKTKEIIDVTPVKNPFEDDKKDADKQIKNKKTGLIKKEKEKLFNDIKETHPEYEDWQIHAIIAEREELK